MSYVLETHTGIRILFPEMFLMKVSDRFTSGTSLSLGSTLGLYKMYMRFDSFKDNMKSKGHAPGVIVQDSSVQKVKWVAHAFWLTS